MTLMVVNPGLRDAVTIQGYSFAIPPNASGSGVQAEPQYVESVKYFVNTSAHVSRPLTWSDETLGIASPDVARKWSIRLTWETMSRRDYIQLQTILSRPGPIDVCLWRPIVERFTMDGVKRTVTLSAMPAVIPSYVSSGSTPVALVTNPIQGFAAYCAQIYKDNVQKDYREGGWALAADVLGRYPIGIPAASGSATYTKGTIVDVYYVPVFRCRRAGAECSFPMAASETLQLDLEQLG